MTVTEYGDWTAEQSIAAFTALKAHGVRTADNPLSNEKSAALIYQRITDGVLRAAFIGGFFVVFDIGPTWSIVDDILYELLLIRVTAEGDFDAYVGGLQELARKYGCTGIMTGNGVLRPGLARQYTKRGFIKINEAYFMEV